MKAKQTYKGLTKRTKQLISTGENDVVDYKKNVKGIKSEDLVAFANSDLGGVLLIGVDEKTENNIQVGEIVGCDTGDGSKLVIMSKALGASPPISLSIFIENISDKPIFRIEIPSGAQKPYCTEAGTYKIRKDGRNHALKPEELLDIYLIKEANKFNERFQKATQHLLSSIEDVGSTIDWMESTISSKVEDMASTVGWAEYESTNAKNTIEDVENQVRTIKKDLSKTYKRIKALIDHQDIKDPVRLDYMNEIANEILPQIQEDQALFARAKKGNLDFTLNKGEFELTDDEMKKIIKSCVTFIENPNEEEE